MGQMLVSDMRAEVEANLGNRSIGGRVDIWLNFAYFELVGALEFPDFHETNGFNTQAGLEVQDFTDLTGFTNLLSIDGVLIPLENQRLEFTDRENFFMFDPDSEGVPRIYTRGANNLRLWPTPDAVYTVQVLWTQEPTKLSDSQTSSEIPSVWDLAIVLLATHFGFQSLQEDDKAAFWFNRAIGYIRSHDGDTSGIGDRLIRGINVADTRADLTILGA